MQHILGRIVLKTHFSGIVHIGVSELQFVRSEHSHWNTVHNDFASSDSVAVFKLRLKTFFFS